MGARTEACRRRELHAHGLVLRRPQPGPAFCGWTERRSDSGFGTAPGGEPTLPATVVEVAVDGASPPRGWPRIERPTGNDDPATLFACPDADRRFLLRFADGPAFQVEPDRIRVHGADELAPAELDWYLLGPVLSLLLALHGAPVLHGSAALPPGGDAALAFVGPSGAGKSTLGAALASRGWCGVSDDLLVLDPPGGAGGEDADADVAGSGDTAATDRWRLRPGAQRRLLWPDSARRLAGAALPPNPCRWDKRALASDAWVPPRPIPLAGVFHLHPAPAGAPPALDPLPPGRAVATLLGNLRHGRAEGQSTTTGRADDLDLVTRLVAGVPVRRLTVPRSYDALPAVLDRIGEAADVTTGAATA